MKNDERLFWVFKIMLDIKKQNILELDRDELISWLDDQGVESYRADQILKWLYTRQPDSFEQMTNLSKDMRARLSEHFTIDRLTID
ncbi:MAG: 23S rRNA (adenine(2503)-C(2))-methyltransferase RlmN, partial [Deltaproteobacteria bacterium]|nr:23S rRNA (adenine(2503)-C(2))-methyltransferase RlmN [Deltaproteobacteria bacterium]